MDFHACNVFFSSAVHLSQLQGAIYKAANQSIKESMAARLRCVRMRDCGLRIRDCGSATAACASATAAFAIAHNTRDYFR